MQIKRLNYLSLVTPVLIGMVLMGVMRWFEQSLVVNILVGYPLLVYFGFYYGRELIDHRTLRSTLDVIGGIPGVLVATFTLAFWMIPRWVDASLAHLNIALIKYLCLILLVGFSLGCSWSRMHFITKAVLKIEFLTMLFRLGWIYMISPDRLCNNYLLGEQVLLGKSLLAIGFLLMIVLCLPLFVAERDDQGLENPKLT